MSILLNRPSDERIGIVLMLVQQILFTLDTAAMHRLASSVSLWQLGLFRSIGGISLAVCLVPCVGWAVFRTHHPTLQLVRAVLIVAYAWVLIYSFTVMPFTGVIFIVVACVVVDREAFASAVRWASACVSVFRRLS